MILKSKNTETITKEKGYVRKLQPKIIKQKYDYKKIELEKGSKEEKLKMRKILKLNEL